MKQNRNHFISTKFPGSNIRQCILFLAANCTTTHCNSCGSPDHCLGCEDGYTLATGAVCKCTCGYITLLPILVKMPVTCIRGLSFVTTAPADDLAPTGAMSLTGTVLMREISLTGRFIWISMILCPFYGKMTSFINGLRDQRNSAVSRHFEC